MNKYIQNLNEPLSVNRCGEKAYNLSLMIKEKLPIPPGLVIPNEGLQLFLEKNQLQSKIDNILLCIDHNNPEDLHRCSKSIHDLIIKADLPNEIISSLKEHLKILPEGYLMVRSSAVGEDGTDSSFAGQLDSFQTNGSSTEVEYALKKCWASYWSERVIFYQKNKGVPLKGMGVVIQLMIKPLFAGVLFSVSPIQNNQDEMLIEYCLGHAEKLVSGEINPGSFTINRKTLKIKLIRSPDQDDAKERIIELKGRERWIKELYSLAVLIEKIMGPCDVEWAVDQDRNNTLYLVQSRPITTLKNKSEAWTYWSNVNVNENYPRPITPMLYSIALQSFYHYFRDLGVGFGLREKRLFEHEWELKNIIGAHGARMYYNMTAIHTCLHALPFGDQLSRYFNNFVGDPRDKKTDTTNKNKKRFFTNEFFDFLRMILITTKTMFCIPYNIHSLEYEIDQYVFSSREKLNKEDAFNKLKNRFHGFLFIRFYSWKKASIADTMAMISYGLLGSYLSRYFNDSEAKKNTLLQGIPNVVSSIPPQKIWELSSKIKLSNDLRLLFKGDSAVIQKELYTNLKFADFLADFNEFLLNWGHRCSGELMLTEPSFQENPAGLIETLQGYIEADINSPDEQIIKKSKERTRLIWKMSLSFFKYPWDLILWPFKVLIFQFLVAITAQGIRYRERVRLKQTMLYGSFRKTLLDLNLYWQEEKLFSENDDIFYLTFREVSELLTGAMVLRSGTEELIKFRKKFHTETSTYNPPDAFLMPAGEVFRPQSIIKLREQNFNHEEEKTEGILIGLPACGGLKRAKSCHLLSALEVRKLTPGEILVTKQTDPGWASVFPLISALVVERGGMLSHGAIVAREYGIPAVVGVPNATVLIKDSQEITVNGDTGRIELHD